ncbi:MAG: hypothetical protein ACFFDO_01250 [Candidatus Thorarchaeota archaeon]
MESQYAKQRIIRDIKNDDVRIQITGYIKKIVDDKHIVLDDKTGIIKTNIEDVEYNFKENDLINVIGNLIIITSGEKVLKADIIQDMNKLNFDYYQKLYEMKKDLE